MKLKELLRGIPVLKTNAAPETEVTGVVCDSRKVQRGDLFAAVTGSAADGNRYIEEAMALGASVILTAHQPEESIPYVCVADDRLALALLSANFYGHPAKAMTMVGITGTNGKTSVACLCKQVLEALTGQKVGLIGTMENHLGDEVQRSLRTTPESPELQRYLAHMRSAGCGYAVMEVSSHGLHQERVGGIRFQVAAFTNLTAEHLDYHKDMDRYCDAKARLFSRCEKAVVNADDPWHAKLTAACTAPILTVSARCPSGLYAQSICMDARGVRFTAVFQDQKERVSIPVPGDFTVYNALTVLGIVLQLGYPLEAAARVLSGVQGIRGRVEVVPTPGKPYTVMIDYAHTPDGLEKVLRSVRGFCKGRLIVLFGCGGDRDREKRPRMGKIGTQLADIAVITSDNPRTEDPMAIISDILQGVGEAKNYTVFENRVHGIQYAMDIGQKDDIIVLCGKGHETDQDIGGRKLPFDERKIIQSYLEKA